MDKEKTRDEQFLNAFMSCWEVFKSVEPSEIILSAYDKAIERFSIEDIEMAFGNAIGNLKWFPKPVELIQFIESGPGDIADIALVEADKVINAIRDQEVIDAANEYDMAMVTTGTRCLKH